MPFHVERTRKGVPNLEVFQTKRDVFISLRCDNEEVKTGLPKLASYSMWRKTKNAFDFLEEWLYYAQDIKCIGEDPSILGLDDSRQIVYRHDQSIYSTLTQKYKLPSFRDCSQWGNPFMEWDSPEYKQLLNHHRISY